MNRLELATLVCRILGVFWISQAAFGGSITVVMVVWSVAGYWADTGSMGQRFFEAFIISIPSLGCLAVGCFLWKRAFWLAGKLVSDDPAPVTGNGEKGGTTQEGAMSVAMVAIGTITGVSVIRSLVGNFA